MTTVSSSPHLEPTADSLLFSKIVGDLAKSKPSPAVSTMRNPFEPSGNSAGLPPMETSSFDVEDSAIPVTPRIDAIREKRVFFVMAVDQ